jgi:hypothetical protein
MADLKPIGSEKLTGQDKIKRIMEIARYNENRPSNINEISRSEFEISLVDGNNYQIVKEKQGYIIKKTISESETDYIEPMRNRKYYSSYSQALKRLNLLTKEVNRLNENEEGTSLFGEQKKFVLKTPKLAPAPEPEAGVPSAPPAVPSPELPPSPIRGGVPGEDIGMEVDAEATPGGEDIGMEVDAETTPEGEDIGMEVDDMGGEVTPDAGADEEKVTFKTIQKLTGKLTQKIRTLDSEEGMTSENMKYVINMVLSSLDLQNLSEEDKEDIISKFDEESEDLGADDMEGEDMTDDTEVEDIQADMDVPVEQGAEMGEESMTGAIFDSIFKESKVDRVISKYFEVSKNEIKEQREKQKVQTQKKMNSIVKLAETIEQQLASQKFLEENNKFIFIGKTNRKNLVFENKDKQVKISPEGIVL